MRSTRHAWILVGACVVLAGCEDLSPGVAPVADKGAPADSAAVNSAPPSENESTAPTEGDEPATGERESEPANSKANEYSSLEPEQFPNPFGDQQATEPSVARDTSSRSEVRLRTGVALAQTLPSGTAMTFSVSYEFVVSGPAARSKYYLVIESDRGKVIEQPAQLTQEGTLQVIAPSLRPEDGPFTCHIVEVYSGSRRKLCHPYDLR